MFKKFSMSIILFLFTTNFIFAQESDTNVSSMNTNKMFEFLSLEKNGIKRDRSAYSWTSYVGFNGAGGYGLPVSSPFSSGSYQLDISFGLSVLWQFSGLGCNMLGFLLNIDANIFNKHTFDIDDKSFKDTSIIPTISFDMRLFLADPLFITTGIAYRMNFYHDQPINSLSPRVGFGIFSTLGKKMAIDFTLQWEYMEDSSPVFSFYDKHLKGLKSVHNITFAIGLYGILG